MWARLAAELLLAWAWWVKLEEPALRKKDKNPVGIARAAWRKKNAPNNELMELAEVWLAADNNGRWDLIEAAEQARWYGRLRVDDLAIGEQTGEILFELWKATNGYVVPTGLMPEGDEEE